MFIFDKIRLRNNCFDRILYVKKIPTRKIISWNWLWTNHTRNWKQWQHVSRITKYKGLTIIRWRDTINSIRLILAFPRIHYLRRKTLLIRRRVAKNSLWHVLAFPYQALEIPKQCTHGRCFQILKSKMAAGSPLGPYIKADICINLNYYFSSFWIFIFIRIYFNLLIEEWLLRKI